jgi:hypothetical protein
VCLAAAVLPGSSLEATLVNVRVTGTGGIVILAIASIVSPTLTVASGATTAAPQLTIAFSRTPLSAADHSIGGENGTCIRDDRNIAPLDTIVAPYIATHYPRVHPVGSIETGPTRDTTPWCSHNGQTAATSWATARLLQSQYGWRFISHGWTYAMNWPSLTPDRQWRETCGSRNDITNHGLLGANGQFDWPNNSIYLPVQTTYVRNCFSFGRMYGNGITTAAWSIANYGLQLTMGASGGHCHDASKPCYSIPTPKAYTLPSTAIAVIRNLKPGQWLSLQTYVQVTNANPIYATNKTRWDCTSSNPADHWTNDVERYCWSDLRTILAAIPATVIINAPSGVAAVWGMPAPAG